MKLILRRFLLKPRTQTIIIVVAAIIAGLYSHFFCLTINLDKEQFADLLTLFAQLSGILLGFLIGVLFFTFQSKETLKMQWFLEYRKTVDELVAKYVNMPNELNYLSNHLGAVIHRLENVRIDDFPNDNLKDSHDDLEKIVKDKVKIDPVFNREILYIVGKTEQYSNNINLTVIGIWTGFALINSIYKQLTLLIISVLLLFIVTLVTYNFDNCILLSISLSIGVLTLLGFAELVLYIDDFYRNKLSETSSR
jgi:hypothetical protein